MRRRSAVEIDSSGIVSGGGPPGKDASTSIIRRADLLVTGVALIDQLGANWLQAVSPGGKGAMGVREADVRSRGPRVEVAGVKCGNRRRR